MKPKVLKVTRLITTQNSSLRVSEQGVNFRYPLKFSIYESVLVFGLNRLSICANLKIVYLKYYLKIFFVTFLF